MTDEKIIYLSCAEVHALLPDMSDAIDLMEAAFAARAAGRVDMPPKSEILPDGRNFIHAMPCAIGAPVNACGIKWISGYFDNPARLGLPALNSLIVMNDPESGLPAAIMDGSEITTLRTAAVSGMALRRLCPENPETACIIGCGNQGSAHLRALLCTRPGVKEIRVWQPRRSGCERFCDENSEAAGPRLRICDGVEEAVRGAEVLLVTAPGRTDDSQRILRGEWLKPGCTVVTVNHDAEFLRGAIRRTADRVYIDDPEMYTWARARGLFDGIDTLPETLSRLAAGTAPGRLSAAETLFSMPIGIAMDDIACAAAVLHRAVHEERGLRLVR